MKKTTMRIFALMLACVMCLSLAACSGGGDDPAGTTTDGAVTTTTVADDGDLLTPNVGTTTTKSGATKTTKYNDGKKDDTDYVTSTGSKQEQLFGNLRGTKLYISESDNWFTNSLMKQFEEKYGVEVINLGYSYAEEQNKLATIVQSGDKKNYMDVVTLGSTTLLKYVNNNLLMPIDQYLDKTDKSWNYHELESYKRYSGFVLGGKTYGSASNGWGGQFVYYNKTYMEEKGIKDPYEYYYKNGNWTFDTFLQVAKACLDMSANGKTVKTYGVATWDYVAFLQAAGNTGITQKADGTWDITVDDANGMAGLNLIHELYKAGTWGNCSAADFTQRKVAMIIGTADNILSGSNAYEVMSDEIGFVPMPKADKNAKQYIPFVPEGRGVAACSQNPAAAVAWIYEFQRAEVIRNESDYGIANRRTAVSDEHLPLRQEFLKNGAIITTYIDGLTNWYGGNRSLFFEKITTEGKVPASVIDQMLPLLQDSLKQTVG